MYVMFIFHKGCYRNLGCSLLTLFPSVRCLQPAINETPVKKHEYLPITLIGKMMLIKRVESLLRLPVHTRHTELSAAVWGNNSKRTRALDNATNALK